MKVNMNVQIDVILTERGKNILDDYRTELESKIKTKFTSGVLNYDENGKFRTELWNLMNLFGVYLFNGCEIPFENNEINLLIDTQKNVRK